MPIRKAKPSDAKSIHLLAISLGEYYNDDDPSGMSPFFRNIISVESFEKYLEDTRAYEHYVYEVNHQIVGYFSLLNETHFFLLFVDKNQHKKGVAKALVEYALKAKENKKYTVNSSLYAVEFYKKLGFVSSSLVQKHHGMTYQPMDWDRSKKGKT